MQTVTTMNPRPTDLTFYLNVYEDEELLEVCLNQLRKVYPESRLVLRSDGDPNPDIEHIAARYNGECHYGEHLMPLARGGEIVHEMLRLFLRQETRYLFKIDPDTCIFRPFNALPDEACVFGKWQGKWDGEPVTLPSIQGGCLGITKDVARRFHDSGFFLDPALGECPPPWVIAKPLRPRPVEQGLTSIDWTVGWACRAMEVNVIDWPEIGSEWKIAPDNRDLRYAVTHPHKSAEAFRECLLSVKTASVLK